MKNSEYWESRIANDTWKIYNDLEQRNKDLLEMYQEASLNISEELYKVAEKLKTSTPMLSDMHKFGRLTDLQGNMENVIKELGESVEKFGKDNMSEGFEGTYKNVMGQLGKTEFAKVPKKVMEEMMDRPWLGSNFSERLWKNTQVLAVNLNDILTNGITQGKTITEMAIQLNNMMNNGFNVAHKLIRTETMHYLNESAFKGYEDAGCEEVEVWAAQDERVCKICGPMHGKVYKIKKRPVLPLHANCRCTYLPILNSEGKIKVDSREYDLNYNHKVSNVRWKNYIDINDINESKLNDIHTELNKFMLESKGEKLNILSIGNSNILMEQVGEIDKIKLSKGLIDVLIKSDKNDIIFAHNHPSKTTFSRDDIKCIIKYKSINSLTVECSDGSKYILSRGSLKSSLLDRLNFDSVYHNIYHKVSERYPDINDEDKIYNIWDDFLNSVTIEVAKKYGMIYEKVSE